MPIKYFQFDEFGGGGGGGGDDRPTSTKTVPLDGGYVATFPVQAQRAFVIVLVTFSGPTSQVARLDVQKGTFIDEIPERLVPVELETAHKIVQASFAA